MVEPLQIVGAGARRTVIDASGIRGGGRVFEGIGAGALLVLERLAVTGGDVRTDGVAGIANEGGSVRSEGRLTLVEVAVRGNRAFVGGGVHVAGFFVMVRSTVGGNTTASDGGGLTLLGEASVVNSTMSGNEVTGLNNGAAVSLGSTGDLTAVNVTIADNRSADPERAAITGGGDAQAIFQNSVLANAPTADCHTFLDVESLGRNLSGDDTCRFSAAGDLTSIDAKLGPLRDNGGQTDTHALRRGSPAIDAAIAGAPDEDQRGITRPQGANADSGAFEKTRRRR